MKESGRKGAVRRRKKKHFLYPSCPRIPLQSFRQFSTTTKHIYDSRFSSPQQCRVKANQNKNKSLMKSKLTWTLFGQQGIPQLLCADKTGCQLWTMTKWECALFFFSLSVRPVDVYTLFLCPFLFERSCFFISWAAFSMTVRANATRKNLRLQKHWPTFWEKKTQRVVCKVRTRMRKPKTQEREWSFTKTEGKLVGLPVVCVLVSLGLFVVVTKILRFLFLQKRSHPQKTLPAPFCSCSASPDPQIVFVVWSNGDGKMRAFKKCFGLKGRKTQKSFNSKASLSPRKKKRPLGRKKNLLF